MSTRNEVLEIIREMPGVNAGEIIELMPHVGAQSVHSSLNWLYVSGAVKRETGRPGKQGRPVFEWRVSDDKKPPVRPVKSADRASPTIANSALKQRIADLEAWKADAIARFPELGVDPIIIQARKMVAAELRSTRESEDGKSADAVMAGHRDGVLAMRLVIKMLEGAA